MAKLNYEKLGGIEEISREITQTAIPHVYQIEEVVKIHGVTYLCKAMAYDYSMERID